MFIYPFDKKNLKLILFYNENMPNILSKQSSVSSGLSPSKVSSADRQALLNSNPYANAQYKESPWQQLLTSLGFRTGADAWRENMAVQSAEYEAQMFQKQYDEDYNLPINQVARLRAAGINPDLEGGASVSSGEAAQPGQDPSVPIQSQGDEGMVLQVANGVMSAFSSALGMVQAIQGIHAQKLQNTLLSIEGEKQFQSFTEGIAPSFLPESPNSEGIVNYDWKSVALQNAAAFAGDHLPKSMQKKFTDYIEQYWSSALGEGESYDDFKKRISSKRGYAMESQTFWSEFDDVLLQITEPLAEMSEKIFKQGQSAELHESGASEKEAIYSEGLYDEKSGLNPAAAAAAENATNAATASKQSSLAIVQGTINDIMSNLKSASKKKGVEGALSSIALALISGLYLYVQSGASFHSSAGYHQGPRSSGGYRSFGLEF